MEGIYFKTVVVEDYCFQLYRRVPSKSQPLTVARAQKIHFQNRLFGDIYREFNGWL